MISLEENRIEMNVEEKKRFGKKEKKILVFNVAVLAVTIIIGIIIANFRGFNFNRDSKDAVDFSGVSKICELSTLKCYYHNVAELKEDPDGLFRHGWFKYGFKKMWMEYTGVIEVGIDAEQLQVNEPDENNIVCVYIPDAKITKVSADSDSMSEPISDTGIFTKITTEDQNKAFSQAQQEMKKSANDDETILNQAKNNAKKLIEQYIVNRGKEIGENYEVKWIDEQKNKGDID